MVLTPWYQSCLRGYLLGVNVTRRRGNRRTASFELARRRADRAVRQIFRDEQLRAAADVTAAEPVLVSA